MPNILFVIIFTTLLLAGCATARILNDVNLGDTPRMVERKLGEPDSTSASAIYKTYHYRLYEGNAHPFVIENPKWYFIKFKNNRVVAYGKEINLQERQAFSSDYSSNESTNKMRTLPLGEIKVDAYGPGVHSDSTGRAYILTEK